MSSVEEMNNDLRSVAGELPIIRAWEVASLISETAGSIAVASQGGSPTLEEIAVLLYESEARTRAAAGALATAQGNIQAYLLDISKSQISEDSTLGASEQVQPTPLRFGSKVISFFRTLREYEEVPPKLSKEAVERYLAANFIQAVEDLNLQELADISPGRKTPRSLSSFKLVPAVSPNTRPASLDRHGTGCILPSTTIRITYGGSNKPFMDARYGIGLVNKDHLVAIAAAGIDEESSIKIMQIQDVSGMKGRGRFASGLHDGFLWRDTLVAAWVQLALNTRIGGALTVQSSANNYWVKNGYVCSVEHGYDKVAERMEFTKTDNGDWQVNL